jgi:hypothetical protein
MGISSYAEECPFSCRRSRKYEKFHRCARETVEVILVFGPILDNESRYPCSAFHAGDFTDIHIGRKMVRNDGKREWVFNRS